MGRARRNVGPREPNGRASRKIADVQSRDWLAEKEARSVAVEARQRVFGVTEEEAKDPHAGTLLGRMLQRGELSQAQMDAANRYIEVKTSFQRSIGCPPVHDQTRPEGETTRTYEEICAEARRKYEDTMDIVKEACHEARSEGPRTALENIVLRDIQMPFLNGHLRSVLNRLHAHFFAISRKAA
jgi:hypothetical protein